MTPSEFQAVIDATFSTIEDAVERCDDIDIDVERVANVLTLTFENGSQIIVNSQEAVQELWLAARAGGFHFQRKLNAWCNTKDGSDFFGVLSACVSQQAGTTWVISVS